MIIDPTDTGRAALEALVVELRSQLAATARELETAREQLADMPRLRRELSELRATEQPDNA